MEIRRSGGCPKCEMGGQGQLLGAINHIFMSVYDGSNPSLPPHIAGAPSWELYGGSGAYLEKNNKEHD